MKSKYLIIEEYNMLYGENNINYINDILMDS